MNCMWQMWHKNFSKELCGNIIEEGLKIDPVDAVVGFQNYSSNNSVRKSTVRWIDRRHPKLNWLFGELTNYFHIANHNAFGVELWNLNEIQFTEYTEENQGFYDWHNDVNWDDGRCVHRKLSLIIQLTDPETYSGGELEIQPLYLSAPPSKDVKDQGTIVVFPSFLMHKVNRVTRGKRYSLVAWIEGPKWK
jgi:PKHD-type hydroxylase